MTRRTKPTGAYIGKEDDFQKSCARLLDAMKVLWFHPANERKTKSKQDKYGNWYTVEGNALKAKGVKKGIPDVMILEPSGDYIGLAIELKVWPNKPTKEQKEWLDRLKSRGYQTHVCYGLGHFEQIVKEYFGR